MPKQKPQFDPDCLLVTSPFFSPRVLGCLRVLFGLFALSSTLVVLVHEAQEGDGAGYFSYFTHLSLIGLTAYFGAAGVQTLGYATRGDGRGYPLQSWHVVLREMHVLLYTTIVTFPLLVTIVYWALLASPATFETSYSSYANVSQHLLNAAFALFEIICTNVLPMPWTHLPITVVLLGGYLGVAYITHADQGFYPYAFLDPGKKGTKLIGYILGIAVAQCLIFNLVRAVLVLKEKHLVRRFHAHANDEESRMELRGRKGLVG
ncbi:hypothetical protein BD779DRAFT_1613639 [Infundibulicybe gibba]|nr:hypothetical protein BD779DRAFT_1613639 [Infundibulicybe gibba]